MKIVCLDGYTLNPGDLSWGKMEELGEFTLYDRTPKDLILERALGAEILLTNKTPLGRDTLGQLPGLKYVGVLATGYNVVDVKAAKELGVVVTNIPVYGTASVAQMVFALLLELCHRVQRHSDAVMRGDWTNSRDFCFWNNPLIELDGKTMGIVGFGQIGRRAAAIAAALGMNVIANDVYKGKAPDLPGFRWVELDDLLAESDVVSLHCPLTPENTGLINKARLGLMKPSAFLINTSRGGLVVDDDLAEALDAGRVAGAALDVLSVEPPHGSNPLFKARNCLITPHIAWATREARARLMETAAENIAAYAVGKPVNIVHPAT